MSSNGFIGQVNARLLGATVTVSQVKGHSDQDKLGWNLWTDQYPGHVTSAEMYDAANPARVLATFPVFSTNQPVFSTAQDPSTKATITTSYSDLYSILLANGARLRVTTNLASPATLDVALTAYAHNDWAKMGCYG